MKKIIVLLMIFLTLFSFNIHAQEEETLNTENKNIEDLDLSDEKSFSEAARDELLGIASKFDSEEEQSLAELNFKSDDFSLTETSIDNSRHLNLFEDLNFDANYSQQEDLKLETTADFQLEYALNSNTSIRAGYSLLNQEWWDVQRRTYKEEEVQDEDPQAGSDEKGAEDPAGTGNEESFDLTDDDLNRVYQNETDSSSRLGVAYRGIDRLTLSADFIDNNEFGNYNNKDWEITGDSTVFGLEYDYPEGSKIRAHYQIDTAEDVTQRITGVDFAFNNLATFSASYKLLDPAQLENTLIQQTTAWDLGLGLNLNDDYGLALGYELIETEDQEEEERKVSASFEIDF